MGQTPSMDEGAAALNLMGQLLSWMMELPLLLLLLLLHDDSLLQLLLLLVIGAVDAPAGAVAILGHVVGAGI
jgi:hypothetical protein